MTNDKKTKHIGFEVISITPEKKLTLILKGISLNKLKIDPYNVRFQHEPGLGQEEMENRILDESDTKDLCKSIEFSGGLSEPLIVDSNNIVIGGCRRLVCLRLLKRRQDNNELPKTIKKSAFNPVNCKVLQEDATKKDIDLLLARIHVVGKKPWDALNKVAHIYNLYHKHKMSYDDIKKSLGMGKSTVMRFVKSYAYHTEYGKRYSKSDKKWLRKYSYFDEFFKRADLKPFNENVEKFMDWLINGKIEAGIEVRSLSKVIGDEEAMKIFESRGGTVKKAVAYLSELDPSINSTFYSVIKKTIKEVNSMSRDEVMSTLKTDTKLNMLKNLRTKLNNLINDIEKLKKK